MRILVYSTFDFCGSGEDLISKHRLNSNGKRSGNVLIVCQTKMRVLKKVLVLF